MCVHLNLSGTFIKCLIEKEERMTLPNPFLNSSFSKTKPPTSSTSSGFKQGLNPGPGLPQSQISNYKYVPRPQLHHKMQNSNNYIAQYLPFSCDRCDRGFKSQEQFDAHVAEHIPCGIDGCKFVAHPKIVEKHVMMQHETGLAEQIMRLNTPEEIQKWRDQRKKLVNTYCSCNILLFLYFLY